MDAVGSRGLPPLLSQSFGSGPAAAIERWLAVGKQPERFQFFDDAFRIVCFERMLHLIHEQISELLTRSM